MAKVFLQHDALAPLLPVAIYSDLYIEGLFRFFTYCLGYEHIRLSAVEMAEYVKIIISKVLH
ncbi:MAG: hypothetical protein QXF14_03420 [Candidatus Woesearchaeota archaeon]